MKIKKMQKKIRKQIKKNKKPLLFAVGAAMACAVGAGIHKTRKKGNTQ